MSFFGSIGHFFSYKVYPFFRDIFKSAFEKQVAAILPIVEDVAARVLADPSLVTDDAKRAVLLQETLKRLQDASIVVGRDVLQAIIDAVLRAAKNGSTPVVVPPA